jgi:hypothetical protein
MAEKFLHSLPTLLSQRNRIRTELLRLYHLLIPTIRSLNRERVKALKQHLQLNRYLPHVSKSSVSRNHPSSLHRPQVGKQLSTPSPASTLDRYGFTIIPTPPTPTLPSPALPHQAQTSLRNYFMNTTSLPTHYQHLGYIGNTYPHTRLMLHPDTTEWRQYIPPSLLNLICQSEVLVSLDTILCAPHTFSAINDLTYSTADLHAFIHNQLVSQGPHIPTHILVIITIDYSHSLLHIQYHPTSASISITHVDHCHSPQYHYIHTLLPRLSSAFNSLYSLWSRHSSSRRYRLTTDLIQEYQGLLTYQPTPLTCVPIQNHIKKHNSGIVIYLLITAVCTNRPLPPTFSPTLIRATRLRLHRYLSGPNIDPLPYVSKGYIPSVVYIPKPNVQQQQYLHNQLWQHSDPTLSTMQADEDSSPL